jgi:alditol oxidase
MKRMQRERNWSGNHVFEAHRIHRPTSVDEVRRIVSASPKIHAIGARHSFNGVADSPGDLIDLRDIDPRIQIDPDRRTVTVGAGTNYSVLAARLHAQGWALHNMASLPHITVVGAVSTGTHGSGDKSGALPTAVAALEMVTATGDLIELGRGQSGFDGIVVGLGAFGVITRVTLAIEPTYEMRQDAFEGLPWATVLADLDAVTSAASSFSLMTLWSGETVSRLWIKTRLINGRPLEVSAAHVGARPASTPLVVNPGDGPLTLTPFGIPGPWFERLIHLGADQEPGPLEQIQSEYLIPRAHAPAAFAKLRAIGDRIDPHLFISEIRAMAGDELWLSPAYGGDTVALHFTWKWQPDAVAAITAEIEEMLLPLGGRPHWGKVIHTPAARLAPLYPRMQAFRDLARSYDPNGKFRNAFLERHVLE